MPPASARRLWRILRAGYSPILAILEILSFITGIAVIKIFAWPWYCTPIVALVILIAVLVTGVIRMPSFQPRELDDAIDRPINAAFVSIANGGGIGTYVGPGGRLVAIASTDGKRIVTEVRRS